MTVKKLTFAFLFASLSLGLYAQNAAAPYRSFTAKDSWEVGLDLGVPFVTGDISAKAGFGGGLHARKSLDHIFSLRGSILYAKGKNEETTGSVTSSSKLNWFSGDLQAVAALNNFRFDKPTRKWLFTVFGGVGVDNFSTDYTNVTTAVGPSQSGSLGSSTNMHLSFGAGLTYRVSPRFNIGLEHTVYMLFGKNADLLDSDENYGQPRTSYRDLLNFPHLTLNFNIAGKNADGSNKAEPLYWSNPLGQVSDAITALEARPIYNPTDTDGDGIIDDIDQEKNSPAGARVDSKGVTLDSDGDKVPDYKDKEPFSPPGYAVDANGVAQVPKAITESDVNRIVDAKIAAIKFPTPKPTAWFFPMVNFKDNSYALDQNEYDRLYQVASVMKDNPDMKVVVTGGADKRASEKYNNVLSYNRAKAAIDFLVAQHSIPRDHLILNWVGEGSPIVTVDGANRLNRRVEFRVAKSETEMARPEGPEAGKAGPKSKASFKANKDAGY
jgi:outer membrane protein OmpA-like peptidoglycan-associated protein/opacity protein-like surface antigen